MLFLLISSLLLSLPAFAALDTCVFTVDTTCSSVTTCSSTQPSCTGGEGNLSGGDDLWQIGDGRDEISTLTFSGAAEAETFTVTLGAETSAPVSYTATSTQLAKNLRDAMEAMPNLSLYDFSVDCSATVCTLSWKGAFACQDVTIVCASSQLTCVVGTTQAGSAGSVSEVTVTLTGFTQPVGAGIGVQQRCNGSAVSSSNSGGTLTIGQSGWVMEPKAKLTLLGGVRQVGVASPSPHAPPHTSADVWRVWDIENCPAANCLRRRLFFNEQGHTATADPGNPYYYEALGNVATTDLVCFHPGSSSMDEGFCYKINAVVRADPCTGSNCYIEIDVAQSSTNSVGLTLAQKGTTQVGLAEAVSLAEGAYSAVTNSVPDPITVDDGVITADDLFVGWCVYIGDFPYRVRRTTASSDEIQLLSEAGSVSTALDTEVVTFSRSCHRPGDELIVIAPITLKSATPGVSTAADQEDTDIRFAGELNLRNVLIEFSGSMVEFAHVVGTVDFLWSLDRGETQEGAFRFTHIFETNFGLLSATGGPDTIGGTYAMCDVAANCNWHGYDVIGGADWIVDWLTFRHLGDDVVAGYDNGGGTRRTRVKNLRAETRMGVVDSMETINNPVTVDNFLALNVTSRGPGGGAGTVFESTVGPVNIGSGAIIYGSVLETAGSSGRKSNLYAVRMNDTFLDDNGPFIANTASNLKDYDHLVLEDWSSLGDLELVEGCTRLANSILLPGVWTEDSSEVSGLDWLIRIPACSLSDPIWIRNNAIIDLDIVPGGAQAIRFFDFESASSRGEVLNNLVYWRTPPADSQPDSLFVDAGFDLNPVNVKVGGNAVIGFGTATPTWNVDAADTAEITAGQHPFYFANNVQDYNTATDQDMPVGTIIGPRPNFEPHSFVTPSGTEMDRIKAGVQEDLGICSRQPFHKWLGISENQTCWGRVDRTSRRRSAVGAQ